MLIPTEKYGIYKDHRNDCFTFKQIGENRYKVVQDDFYIQYISASDQYLIAENNYWDPVSENVFIQINGMNYNSMFEIPFIYSYGYYLPVPEVKNISSELVDFLSNIWSQQQNMDISSTLKSRLNNAYHFIYSKLDQNTKKNIADGECLDFINNIVLFSKDKTVNLQFKLIIPDQNIMSDDLFKILNLIKKGTEEVRGLALNNLLSNYYYFTLSNEVWNTTRIILNVAPMLVMEALDKLWPILKKYSSVVHSIKAGGPFIAAKKIDSIIIYAKSNQINALLEEIKNAGIITENLLPAMITEFAKGIGVADEPRMIGNTSISFGQKRVALAILAYSKINTLNEMINMGAIFFRQGGVSIEDPNKENKLIPNKDIQSDLLKIITQWNKRD